MKTLLFTLLLALPVLTFAQHSRAKGEVFKHRPDSPTEDLDKSGLIVVTYNLTRLVFEDTEIPQAYKNMVDVFFKEVFHNKYKKVGTTYRLKVEKRAFGDIYIEDVRVGNIKDVP